MRWLNDLKAYHDGTKRWYCYSCDKRTPIELNPEWVKDGKPMQWDDSVNYEWFSRCTYCHDNHYYSSGNCPNCGAHSRGEPIEVTKPIINSYYSREFGVTGYDWDERHQCRYCRTKYWIGNSTC